MINRLGKLIYKLSCKLLICEEKERLCVSSLNGLLANKLPFLFILPQDLTIHLLSFFWLLQASSLIHKM